MISGLLIDVCKQKANPHILMYLNTKAKGNYLCSLQTYQESKGILYFVFFRYKYWKDYTKFKTTMDVSLNQNLSYHIWIMNLKIQIFSRIPNIIYPKTSLLFTESFNRAMFYLKVWFSKRVSDVGLNNWSCMMYFLSCIWNLLFEFLPTSNCQKIWVINSSIITGNKT